MGGAAAERLKGLRTLRGKIEKKDARSSDVGRPCCGKKTVR